MRRVLILLCLCLGMLRSFPAQLPAQTVVDWTFHPHYTLPGKAANYPGTYLAGPQTRFDRFRSMADPVLWYGQQPTERMNHILEPEDFPVGAFTVELWWLDHVNMPVGAMTAWSHGQAKDDIPWLVGIYDRELTIHLQTDQGVSTLTDTLSRGFKQYWGHLMVTYDGTYLKLYIQGELTRSVPLKGRVDLTEDHIMEIAGYFEEEPYMQISNFFKRIKVDAGAMSVDDVGNRYQLFQEHIEAGHFFADTLHFNAGPYLHLGLPSSMNITWETNQPATAMVLYGQSLPFTDTLRLADPAYIREVTLSGLTPESLYYYEIVTAGLDGDQTSSGLLTFGTGVRPDAPFSFCILGDTESRPHINHQLGLKIWEERPNFIMHLGDVTDGGVQTAKFQWNHEYFTGITPVASRIPVFPVPGNGEHDLYWYKRYHRLPDPEDFYAFRYGNADFFMLNSNAREELLEGGRQHEWLKQALAASDADWKFVAHHHCPVSSDENDFGDTWRGEASSMGDPRFDDLKSLYESGGVDVVFYGHVHAYERSRPLTEGIIDEEDGVIYLMSGGAGGNLEDFVPSRAGFSQVVRRGHHYCRVELFQDELHFRMFDTEGRLQDFFDLKK